MKRRVDVVGAPKAVMHRRVGADDVVIGEDVGKPQFLDALTVRAKGRGIRGDFGLWEDNSDAHSVCNHVASGLLPAQRKTLRTNPQRKLGFKHDVVVTAKKVGGVRRVGEMEPTFEHELAARYAIPRLPDGTARTEFLAEHGADVRVLVTSGSPGADAATIAALPNLEVIVNNGAGVDLIDLGAAKRRGIGVSNTPDVLSDTVADTAVGLILMTLRRFGAADRFVRAGRWAREGPFPYARDVSGLQVGILGLGRIGSAIATRLLGFDCAIAYHNRHRIEGSPFRYAESPVELAESADVLVIATTGDRNTHKLVEIGRAHV